MASFFDFIADNLFIAIIIIVALLNLFNRGKKENEEERRQQQPTNQRPHPSRQREERRTTIEQSRPIGQAKQSIETAQETVSESLKTIEEQRKEQYDRLRSQYQDRVASTDYAKTTSYLDVQNKIQLPAHEDKTVKRNIRLEEKLKTTGLIESIMMAEVLGPPRSLQPYQNIIDKRRQK